MKYLLLYENFKYKNISIDDVINCILNRGYIFSEIIKEFPDNDPEKPLKPLDIDNDGLITIDYDGNEYLVDIKDVTKITNY